MNNELPFFQVMDKFPKSFKLFVYLIFAVILISISAVFVRSLILSDNKTVTSYSNNYLLNDSIRLKNDSAQNSEYIKYQKEILNIDTIRRKHNLPPISDLKEFQNGNIIDGGKISNLIYYAIFFGILILVTTFRRTVNYLYLILNFCFTLLLIGLYALLTGIISPTHIIIKGVQIDIITSSVGLLICGFATIIVYKIVGKMEKGHPSKGDG